MPNNLDDIVPIVEQFDEFRELTLAGREGARGVANGARASNRCAPRGGGDCS
jgi:hypothetical protein